MVQNHKKDYSFEDVKQALLNKDKPFPSHLIYYFSDSPKEDLSKIAEVWPQVWTERRRGLLEDMEKFSEADTLLFFDPLAMICLDDPDPIARATAIRLLWQSEDENLAPKLLKMLEDDPEVAVRAAAATALGIYVYYGELEEISTDIFEAIITALIETYLSADDVLVRRRALESLGYASHADVPVFIQQAYDTEDEEWLQSALFAMGRTCDLKWTSQILAMMDHPDSVVRYEALRAAGELEAQDAREPLFDLLEEGTDDEDLYFAAIWSLTKIGGDGVRKMIEMNLEETDDMDEISFLEEAMANLDFTEQTQRFDLMDIDELLEDEGILDLGWDDEDDEGEN